jgi:putative transposase
MDEDMLVDIPNEEVVDDIKDIAADPDLDYGYHRMTFALMQLGYLINHKKVYRLMDEHDLLKEKCKRPKRSVVKYRKVLPTEPLQVLEMDIKFVWVEEHRRHAFILTVIDTFTRVLLGRKTAYNIKQALVQELWEEVIENHLQPYDCLNRKIDIEIRNDNDSRFAAKKVQRLL